MFVDVHAVGGSPVILVREQWGSLAWPEVPANRAGSSGTSTLVGERGDGGNDVSCMPAHGEEILLLSHDTSWSYWTAVLRTISASVGESPGRAVVVLYPLPDGDT